MALSAVDLASSRAEYERVSKEFDKLGLGPVDRLIADVRLMREHEE